MNKKNILIVEDEPKILEFTESYIKNSGYNTYTATNGMDAIRLFDNSDINLVLLDLMLPDISGEDVCKHIRKYSNIPIIMITAKTDEKSIIDGLKLGADDYISKPFSPRQLVARVDALFRRTTNYSDIENLNIIKIDSLIINRENYSIAIENVPVNLTPTEMNILITLISRKKKVFTRDELANIVFDGQYEGYTRSLDSHIKNIRNKISIASSHNYIETVRGIGYRYNEKKASNDEV